MAAIRSGSLIRDNNGVPVQICPLANSEGVETAFDATQNRLTLPEGFRAFMFTAVGGNCRIKFGDSTVAATDAAGSIVFLAGSAILIIPPMDTGALPTHVSVIGVGSDTGLFQVWPMAV